MSPDLDEDRGESLIVVSNRLPVTLSRSRGSLAFRQSAGGLASALAGMPRESFLWIGWSGTEIRPEERSEVTRRLREEHGSVPVFLSLQQAEQYYSRFSNGVLWPLFHYLPEYTDFDLEGWERYQEVNAEFAEVIDRHAGPGALVWIHDYQLMLAPRLLRERRPDLKIAFFLHIPFPSSEVYRLLPVRSEILEGMLGADYLGFHTFDYARHFLSSCQRLLGCDLSLQDVDWDGRRIKVAAHPIGIDYDRFEQLLGEERVGREIAALRSQLGGRRVILGVDRLDYSKGLRHRLLAYSRFLEKCPQWRGKVVLIQVAVPSRTEVQKYRELRRGIEELVGRISGLHGEPGFAPIHFLFKGVPPATLSALYQMADVCWVTPIRDGMNLVCQEYAASRPNGDGVLVLSEFAGAARSLEGAILVNPWNRDQMADALLQALEMNPEEQRNRMKRMQRVVRRGNSREWAKEFLAAAQAHRGTASVLPERWIERNLEAISREFLQASRRVLLLDYDGTLTPVRDAPAEATPEPALLELLDRVSRLPDTSVFVSSGRSAETMSDWFSRIPVGLSAEHGRLVRDPGGEQWKVLREVGTDWMETVLPSLERYAALTPGAIVVKRATSLEWHWRRCEPEFGQWQARELAMDLSQTLANVPVQVIQGPRVVEIRAQGVHKGLLVEYLRPHWRGDEFILAVGDDEVDEEVYSRLPAQAWSVHVGRRSPRARFLAKHQETVPSLLRHLVDRVVSRADFTAGA